MKTIVLFTALMMGMLLTADEAKSYLYTFDKPNNLKLSGDAKVENGLLRLFGAGQVEIPGSADMIVSPAGLTMSTVVRLHRKEGSNLGVDFFSKGQEWLFSRDGAGKIYFTFYNGNKWQKAVRSGTPVPPGQWAHYAASFTRIQREGQGEVGYQLKAYINGELICNMQILGIEPKSTSSPVTFGWGLGKNVWALRGDVASIKMWKRALSDDEIEKDAISSTLVKVAGMEKNKLTSAFTKALEMIQGEDASWLRKSFRRAAENGADQELLASAIAGKQKDVYRILESPRGKALFLLKGARRSFPLIGFYDRFLCREVFGRRTMNWRIQVNDNGKIVDWLDSDKEFKRSIVSVENGIIASWEQKGIIIRSKLLLTGGRIVADMNIDNRSAGILLREIAWPCGSFAKLDKNDRIVIPFMGGVEHHNPIEEQSQIADQDYYYPSSNMNLQMGAYYDDRGGIYYAHEDPTAGLKRITFLGRRGDLDVSFSTTAGFQYQAKGGNSYQMNGVGAFELFSGNWFDAAQIYKRFLVSKAPWWVQQLPRTETPEWFRNHAVWFFFQPYAEKGLPESRAMEDMIRMRKFFDLPIGIHTTYWYDEEKCGSFPHFRADETRMNLINELRRYGIRVTGYIDDRLWAKDDAPGKKSSWMFNPFGLKYALWRENGETPQEVYRSWHYEKDGRGWYYTTHTNSVMCPASRGWQDWVRWICEDIAHGPKLDGIYHDQITAALPFTCFNPEHGHLMNDSAVWYTHGFKIMLETIRTSVARINPETFHNSEDGAEPFCKGMLDGCLNWRWTHEMVPLFVSLYAGRFQFYGRIYGDPVEKNSDRGAFFAKAAEQLVWAEQIGGFYNNNYIEINDGEAMLFAKRMAHLRVALLPYLNASEMLRPLTFQKAIPTVGYRWNAYRGGSGGGDRIVNTPQVRHSFWQRQSDGAKMAVFVNSEKTPISIEPILPGISRGVVLVDDSAARIDGNFRLMLKPRGIAIIIAGNESLLKKEKERLAPIMKKIAAFRLPDDPKIALCLKPARNWLLATQAKLDQAYSAADGSFVGWMSPRSKLHFDTCLLEIDKGTIELEINAPEFPETVMLFLGKRYVGKQTTSQSGLQTLRFHVENVPKFADVSFVFTQGGAEAIRWRLR